MIRWISSRNNYRNQTIPNGWKCFEAPGVQPEFLEQEHAIGYATGRACFRSGEIRKLNERRSHASFHLVRRIEDCDAKVVSNQAASLAKEKISAATNGLDGVIRVIG